MSRRERDNLAPSLFPFLAVLVCTLGTLILLLALVAQQAAESAEQRAREEIIARAKKLESDSRRITETQATAMIDEAEFHINTIEKIRDQQAADLESRRDELTHLEDHIQRLRKEIDRLNAEMVSTIRSGADDQVDSETIAMLKDRLREEELAIKELQEQKGNETPRVVIVPHKGPNGTLRRPIYVECTADGLTIWPEGVKIETAQLASGRSRTANPLDAALRVARLHIMQTYGDSDPPYPLLVVRPSGTEAYLRATFAMDAWDDQYGYEMLDRGIELAFTTPDPNLKLKMEQAIRAALAKQSTRRTPRVVPLSASQLSRDGNSRGFHQSSNYDFGSGGSRHRSTNLEQQINRLDDLHDDAAEELRAFGNPYASSATAGLETDDPGNDLASTSDGQPRNDFGIPGGDQQDAANAAPGDDRSSEGAEGKSASNGSAPLPAGQDRASSTAGGEFNPNSGAPLGGASADAGQPFESLEDLADQRPQLSSSVDRSAAAQAEKLVQRVGSDWALPKHVAAAGGITIVRAIRVELHSDRFVLPATRTERAVEIPFNGNLDRASLQLATTLRDRIDRWGVALDNGRWVPMLEVDSVDGDVGVLEQLNRLFHDSGIEINQRPAK